VHIDRADPVDHNKTEMCKIRSVQIAHPFIWLSFSLYVEQDQMLLPEAGAGAQKEKLLLKNLLRSKQRT
jgi:hypothetical protein